MASHVLLNGVRFENTEINRMNIDITQVAPIAIFFRPSNTKVATALSTKTPQETTLELFNDNVSVALYSGFTSMEAHMNHNEIFGFEEHVVLKK